MSCETTNLISIISGDTETISLTFKDQDSNLIDITGYTVFLTVKQSVNASKSDDFSVIKKDVTVHSDPVNGATEVVLSSSDTAVRAENYVYDIQIKDVSGNITTVVRGDFHVTNDITKRTA